MCILLVEDDAPIRDLVSEVLVEEGFQVRSVEDGVVAMQLLAEPRRFYVLLTDFHLPGGIDGSQVAEQVRRVFPEIPVIMVFGRPDVLVPNWQVNYGYQFLVKPFTMVRCSRR